MRQQVDELQRDIAQLRRNNADTPSVATRGNATPILPSPDLAQLQGRIEQQEKDLGARNKFNFSTSKSTTLRQNAKRNKRSSRTCAIASEISPTQIRLVTGKLRIRSGSTLRSLTR